MTQDMTEETVDHLEVHQNVLKMFLAHLNPRCSHLNKTFSKNFYMNCYKTFLPAAVKKK